MAGAEGAGKKLALFRCKNWILITKMDLWVIFLGLSEQSQNIFSIFLLKSIQNVSKHMVKRKSRNRKFFLLQIFSWTLLFFGPKLWKKWQSQRYIFLTFFGLNRFRMFQNLMWSEILEIENFYRNNFFWDLVIFGPKWFKTAK